MPTEENKVTIGEDEKENLVNSVVRDFEDAQRRREPYEEVWDRCYKLYNSWVKELPKKDWHSNIFVPKCFSLVETELPRIILATIAIREFFGALPVNPHEIKQVKLVKQLITYQVNDEIKIFLKWVDYLKQLIMYGNSPGKVYWSRKWEKKKFRSFETPESSWFSFASFRGKPKSKEIIEERDIKIYDGPQFDFVDLYDFFPALPSVSTLEEQPYLIHRTWRDMNYLKEIQKNAGYDPEGIAALGEKGKEGEGGITEDSSQKRMSEIGIHTSDFGSGRLWILERYKNEKVTTIEYDNKVLLRHIDNPYEYLKNPFIFTKHTPVPGEFFGKGIIEPNAKLQFALNEIVNYRLDNVYVLLNKVFKGLKGADIDWETIEVGPNKIMLVDAMENLQEFVMSDVTSSSYAEQAGFSEMMQETSGIWPYSQGRAPQRKETASGIMSLQQAAEIRFQLIALIFQHSGVVEFVEKVHGLNRQFLPEEKRIRILGPEGLKFLDVPFNDVNIDCDFIAVGHPTMGNKQLMLQQMLMIAQYLSNRPGGVNQYEIDRAVLEAADIENIDEILEKPPTDRLSPQDENKVMAMGELVNVNYYDRHGEHAPVHMSLLQSPELNPSFRMIIESHIREHQGYIDSMMQQRTQQMNQAGAQMPASADEERAFLRPTGPAEGQKPAPLDEVVRRMMQGGGI